MFSQFMGVGLRFVVKILYRCWSAALPVLRLFLVKSDLEWSEQERDILGQGGSGTIIYRAKYRGAPVAIKRFPFKKCRQHSLNSGTGLITSFSVERSVNVSFHSM